MLLAVMMASLGLSLQLCAQAKGVLGEWMEPTGTVIRIDRCGGNVCMRIVALSKQAPANTDIYNPNPSLHKRSLCDLEIGSGFVLRDADHAIDGTLYDPKTGKTYHGRITAEGTTLHLRGYVGIPLFGASQTWTRPAESVEPCEAAPGK